MVLCGRARIVVGTAEALGVEAGPLERAVAAQIDHPVAARVARQWVALGDDGVAIFYGFAPQVDDLEFAPEFLVVEANQVVEACNLADLLEVAIVLRCLGDRYAPLHARGQKCVVGRRAQYSAVGDDRFDSGMSGARVGVGIPVSDEVWLEDDVAPTGSQCAERIPIGSSKIFRVESEAPEGGPNCGVDVVRRLVGVRISE